MTGFIERLGSAAATEEQLDSRRKTAEMLGGQHGAAYLDSIPHMASYELIRLTMGDPYTHIKEAVAEELTVRLQVLDEIIAERRQ